MIVSSEVIGDSAQIDGRRHIIERHVDQLGGVYLIFYMSEALQNVLDILLARVPRIEANLKQQEIDQATDGNSVKLPVFNSGTEFLLGWREKYKQAKGQELVSMIIWMEAAILSGLVTPTQLMNVFGLSQVQWDALKSQWDDYKSKLEFVNSAAGS